MSDDMRAGAVVLVNGRTAAVVGVRGGQVHVFLDGRTRVVDIRDVVPIRRRVRATAEDLRRHILAIKFDKPLSDNLYSVSASRTKFQAHQFKPAIKFFDSPRHRLLIADEVGLGKTIEAGIILAELNARSAGPLDRVVVVCPSGLKEKWYGELLRRFGEEFQIASASDMRKAFEQFDRESKPRFKLICPLEAIRAPSVQNTLLEAIANKGLTFDLTIVDEAHHLRNAATASHAVGRMLAYNSASILFLTATPVQLGRGDLFHLLSLLDEEVFPSQELFVEALAPNVHVNQLIRALRARDFESARLAQLELAGADTTGHFVGSPFFERLGSYLEAPKGAAAEIVSAVRDAQELNTLNPILTRTRKRDVQRAAVRRSTVVRVHLTPAEEAYYSGVVEYARRMARAAGRAPSFDVVMRERQAASSIPGSIAYFRAAPNADDGRREVEGWLTDAETDAEFHDEPRDIDDLLLLGRRCTRDSKLEELIRALRTALEEKPSRKILLFSFFKRTLAEIHKRLRQENIPAMLIDGSVPPVRRAERIHEFRQGTTPILLSSEVGSEGLDFQFCDTVVNYDLPWNPMKVEQRIGRLDRFGQESEAISIISFVLADTVEERILLRLYDRIRVFEESIGDLEPILGPIVSDLERDVFRSHLTPEEEEARGRALDLAIETGRRELESFSQRMDEFLGTDELIAEVQERGDRGLTVTSRDVREAVGAVADRHGAVLRESRFPGIWDLADAKGLSDALRRFGVDKHLTFNDEQEELVQRLSRGRAGLMFDGEAADRDQRVPFVGVGHPLMRLAIGEALEELREHGQEAVYAAELPLSPDKAEIQLDVFRFMSDGAASRSRLFPVATQGDQVLDLNEAWSLFGQLRDARDWDHSSSEFDWEAIEHRQELAELVAVSEREAVLNEVEARNDAVLAAREASIKGNLERQMRFHEEQARNASDSRIITMHRGAARNRRDELERELARLEQQRHVFVDFEHLLTVIIGPISNVGADTPPMPAWGSADPSERPALPPQSDFGPVPVELARLSWGKGSTDTVFVRFNLERGVLEARYAGTVLAAAAIAEGAPSLEQVVGLLEQAKSPIDRLTSGKLITAESRHYAGFGPYLRENWKKVGGGVA